MIRRRTDGFGRRLQQAREASGMTRTDLYVAAEMCGGPAGSVNPSIVTAYELGHRDPRTDRVGKLAAALGVHPAWLAFGDESLFPVWLWDASVEGAAHRVHVARAAADLTQAELAARAGWAQEEVSNIERRVRLPPISLIDRIATVLQVKPAWLAYWAGPQKE